MTRAFFVRTTVLFLAAFSFASARDAGAGGQPTRIPASAYAALHWRNIGPFRGGRALAVAGVPGDPDRFYFGAVGGGVWTTGNAGRTWTPIFDREPVASIGAIAVAPSDARTLYVGTGEADMRSDIVHGNGVYRSKDAGATWTHVGLEATRQIGRIVVDPHDARVAYVAALGHAYAANAERGVFKTTDGGATWRRVLYRDADTGAIDLALDPHDPRTLLASLWQTRRPPWNVYPPSNGPGSGLYVTHDAGTTWSPVGGGLPHAGVGKIGIAFAPSRPSRVFAIVDAADGGLYRSDDSGATWKRVDADTRLWKRGWYFCHVAVDARDPDRVYVSNTSLYRSEDGGTTFSAIKGAPGGDDYHMLWLDPTAPQRMILASDQGAVVSVDGARSWSSWYNQPTAQLYHVATDAAFPYRVYGAQQDSGAVEVASRTSARGISDRDWHPIDVGGESDSIAPDPLHPGLVYGGRVDREDLATRVVQHVSPTLGRDETFRDVWTLPLAFSAADPHALYFSHQQIFATHDGGSSWHVVSPDLTRPATGDAPRRGVVYALAPSPLVAQQVWAGTDDGLVRLTRDGGSHWSDVTPPGVGPWSKIGTLEASHFDAGTAYAAVDRHRLDDDAPYVYRTRDYGATWTPIVRGLPAGAFVNAVREDPARRGLLYAATETGVAVSFDDGDAWQSLQLDLPTCSVRDLTVRDGDLVVATHGRSFWVLDDLEPLRQAAAASSLARLIAPPVAYRTRMGDDEGTPLPPETPQGENPLAGVPLDYVLPAGTHARVALEIRDATGALVRRYASDDPVPPVDPAAYEFPSFWIPRAPRVATTPGHHRIAWNVRYAALSASDADPSSDAVPAGAWAAPGRYVVRLSVDGATTSQPLELRRDPRVTATDAELRDQYSLARDVETLRARVDAAYAAALSARAHASPAVVARLASIAGFPPPDDPRNSVALPATDFTSLHALRASLGELDDALESADAAPTTDQRAAYVRARVGAEHALAAWTMLSSAR